MTAKDFFPKHGEGLSKMIDKLEEDYIKNKDKEGTISDDE